MRQRLKAMQKEYQFKNVGDAVMDEEHRTCSVSFTDAQGAVRKIDWALAFGSGEPADAGQACADTRSKLVGPFLIEYATKTRRPGCCRGRRRG